MIGYLPDGRLCITQNQLAKILGRGVPLIKYYKRKKMIKSYTDGTHVFYIVDEIKDWAKQVFGVDIEKKIKKWQRKKYKWLYGK